MRLNVSRIMDPRVVLADAQMCLLDEIGIRRCGSMSIFEEISFRFFSGQRLYGQDLVRSHGWFCCIYIGLFEENGS